MMIAKEVQKVPCTARLWLVVGRNGDRLPGTGAEQ